MQTNTGILESGNRPIGGIAGQPMTIPSYSFNGAKLPVRVKGPKGFKTLVYGTNFAPGMPGNYEFTIKARGTQEIKWNTKVGMTEMALQASHKKKISGIDITKKTIMYIILILCSILIFIPFLYALSTSFTLEKNLANFYWIPNPFDIGNYARLFAEYDVFRALLNSFIYLIPPVFVGAFCSALAAYACARIDFKGKKIVYFGFLATMMIPGIITMMPSYLMFTQVYHWNDTVWPIIVPGMFGAVGTMFYLHQYFKTLPKELEEAAQIDGMTRFGVFIKVILPLSVPALITQIILGINGAYNDFMTPALYISNKQPLWTMQLLINSLSPNLNPRYALLMAGAVIALLPTLILYLCAQKFFVDGIAMTGVKG